MSDKLEFIERNKTNADRYSAGVIYFVFSGTNLMKHPYENQPFSGAFCVAFKKQAVSAPYTAPSHPR